MHVTTCPLDCFDGCSITVSHDMKLKGNKHHPITQGYLCHHLNHYTQFERIEEPRYLGQSIGMDEALAILKQMLQTHNPSRTLFFKGSGNLGVMQGVTKTFFAAHNAVLASGSLCDEAGDAGVCEGRGANLSLSPLEVKESDVVILWGRNPSVTNSHMLPALKGKTIIVIDPRKIDLAKNAALHLQIKPKGDLYLALLLCRLVALEEMEDRSFLKERCLNYDDFLSFVNGIPMRKLLDKCAVNIDQVGLLLNTIRGKKVSILVGIGVQKYSFGHSVLRAIDAFGAMLGLFGKKGCGVGYLSSSGHGFLSPFKVEAKKEPLATARFDHYDMVFIQGANPLNQMPCTSRVEKGLSQSQCIVYFGLHENETSAKAHLVIPAKTFLEKEDLKLSYGHPYVGRMPKISESLIGISEYDLTQFLLRSFGHDPLEEATSIIDAVVTSHSVDHEGFLISKTYANERPYEKTFYTSSGRFEFLEEFDDEDDEEEGFFLIAAKQNKSLNSQFMTDDYLYVPKSLGLEQETRVRLSNAYGSAIYSVMPTDSLRDDCLLLYSGAKNANRLTPPKISQEGECAIYQEMKVTLERLA